jgi:hypothetical protein
VPAKKQDQKVKVTVVVILANDRCSFVDPRLKLIAAEAKSQHPQFTGFHLVSMTQLTVGVNETVKFQCVEDSCIEVMVRKCTDEENKVCLSVTPPLQEELTYRTVCGKFLPIMTRYKTKETIPVTRAAKAMACLIGGGRFGPLRAADLLIDSRCEGSLLLAICVQPCAAK